MEIIALIPSTRGDADSYIVKLHRSELAALTVVNCYGSIPVKGCEKPRLPGELQVGDIVDSSAALSAARELSEFSNAREDMKKSAAVMRGALTRVETLLAKLQAPKEEQSE